MKESKFPVFWVENFRFDQFNAVDTSTLCKTFFLESPTKSWIEILEEFIHILNIEYQGRYLKFITKHKNSKEFVPARTALEMNACHNEWHVFDILF